jgi:hypothetical protein
MPQIFYRLPDDSLQTILIGDTIQFVVRARDRDGNEMNYRWLLNGSELDDYDTTSTVRFEEDGADTVTCRISIDAFTVSTGWIITATDLIISAFTPDTLNLTLRRGASVDFSIDTIRYVGDDEPEYVWLKTNLNNGQQEETGGEAVSTIDFPFSGNYTVEGRAYRDLSSAQVIWNVDVRGAILAYVPLADSLEVLADSVVHFEVVPSAPEDESLRVQWFVDGEMVREGEVALDRAFSTVDNCRRYLVQCAVADSVEVDTVEWEVEVRELGVKDRTEGRPGRPALLSVSPNPFNAMLTIRYGLDKSAPTRLGIYDIAGRAVFSVASPQSNGKITPPTPPAIAGGESKAVTHGGMTAERVVVWDASAVPAGVYFVRLEAGREVVTKKVVLMR